MKGKEKSALMGRRQAMAIWNVTLRTMPEMA
jgi:hypothetical protein